ncbi:MAG: MSHA biogenesis protein MshK [Burkholderiales bacterium]
MMGLIFLSVAMPSGAQALTDPTRPPTATGAPVADAETGASGPVLQSILLSPLRKLALIDGHMVRVGDRVGNARVVAIDFDSVKLRRGDSISVMKLLPDVRKKRPESTLMPSTELRPRSGDDSR